ncbi:MAG: stage II sporulation protein R [Clostridia bacterium]|nr:stage II sporulation protein R [Clostridia bacterium]
MKVCKFVAFGVIIAVLLMVVGNLSSESVDNQYLRIHIRANSNLDIDQNIKYAVKDDVVDFLTPYLVNVNDKDSAIDLIQSLLPEIERVCDSVLQNNGYTYTSRAKINTEQFPTRAYGDFVLEEGIYDALIIELGSGEGNNWWCVVYPPLCFVNKNDNSSQNIKYKSKLLEIIEEFFS